MFNNTFYMMLLEENPGVRAYTRKTDTHKQREGMGKKEGGNEEERERRLANRLKSESTDLASALYRGYKQKEKSNYLSEFVILYVARHV